MRYTQVYRGFKVVLIECYSVGINHTLVANCHRLKTKYTHKLPPNEVILAVKLAVKSQKISQKGL